MPTFTPNYNLKKPGNSDAVSIEDINANMDALDEAVGEIEGRFDGQKVKQALQADNATNAENATNADYATSAGSAATASDSPRTLTHTKSGTVHALVGLPTTPGLYTGQFIAAADFNESDTWADGFTAKPTGEDAALPDKAFVAGDLVSLVVDVAGKKLGFKLGGGAAKLNIFCQITQPPVFEGILLKTTDKFKQIILDTDVFVGGEWSPTLLAPMPYYAAALATAVQDNKIYVAGGWNGNQAQRICYAYDIPTNVWGSKAQPTTGFSSEYGSAIVNGVWYVFNDSNTWGGVYTFATNSWNNLNPSPPHSGISNVCKDSWMDKIYAVGGYNAGSYTPQKQIYILTLNPNVWTLAGELPIGRFGNVGKVIGSNFYLIGGQDPSTWYRKIDVIDLHTLTATLAVTDIPTDLGVTGYSVEVIGTRLRFVGGAPNNKCYDYETSTGIWKALPDKSAASDATFFALALNGEKLYALGGYTNGALPVKNTVAVSNVSAKTYDEDDLVIEIPAAGKISALSTVFQSNKKLIGGRLVSYFKNAWLYKDGDLQEYEGYYGDGHQWVKFKG